MPVGISLRAFCVTFTKINMLAIYVTNINRCDNEKRIVLSYVISNKDSKNPFNQLNPSFSHLVRLIFVAIYASLRFSGLLPYSTFVPSGY